MILNLENGFYFNTDLFIYMVCIERSEDSIWELVLHFYLWVLGVESGYPQACWQVLLSTKPSSWSEKECKIQFSLTSYWDPGRLLFIKILAKCTPFFTAKKLFSGQVNSFIFIVHQNETSRSLNDQASWILLQEWRRCESRNPFLLGLQILPEPNV